MGTSRLTQARVYIASAGSDWCGVTKLAGNWSVPKMSTSPKLRNFANEPMGDKPVTAVTGIGDVLGDRLVAKGYDKAYVLFGLFLVFKKDGDLFQMWLKDEIKANSKQATDCFTCLKEWADPNRSNNESSGGGGGAVDTATRIRQMRLGPGASDDANAEPSNNKRRTRKSNKNNDDADAEAEAARLVQQEQQEQEEKEHQRQREEKEQEERRLEKEKQQQEEEGRRRRKQQQQEMREKEEQERQKLANKAQRRKDKPKKNALDKKSYNSLLDWINSDEPAGRPEVAKSILFDNDTDSEEDDDEGDDQVAAAAVRRISSKKGPHRHYNNDDKEVKDEEEARKKQKKKTTTTKKKKSVVATPAAAKNDEERNDDTLQRLQLQHQAGEKSFLDDILGQVLDFSDDDDDNNASGKDHEQQQQQQEKKKKKQKKTVEELRWKNIRHADYFRVIEWVTNGRDDDLHEARDLLFKEDEVMEREDREADEAVRQGMMTDFSSTHHD
ncbi:unnamed protein product [Notodromas monacha]|uniref:Barrier-to-autointegration factor-like protein n=1 Tax=Notodromas monacha TaxID=399045 RepID=A0A7R9BST9_9CRUS|nr:unnamed protein product [Notodromas monacha]CAG0920043.1 unnamed protein product [Notodromas monacha]